MPLSIAEPGVRRAAHLALTVSLAAAACREGELLPPPVPDDGAHTGRNTPPIADAGGPYTSTSGTVRFEGGRSSDPDGHLPLAYEWDFGDGSRGTGVAPVHTYLSDATYTATLTVFDARGGLSGPVQTTVGVNRAGTAVVIAGAGRVARCGVPTAEATARLLDSLPGLVFAAGDNALPHGTASEYRACYHPTWGRHRLRTFAVLGNHEYDQGNANAAFDYFGPRAGPRDLGYYSLELGDWHVVVLNDNDGNVPYDPGSAQERWLQADLAATTRRCVLALWHMPLFLSSNTPNYTTNPAPRALWNALHAAGADVVVNSNRHHYERLAPMQPDGTRDDVSGIRSFNVGTGGESVTLPTAAIHPNSEVRAAVHGVLKLTLRPDRYDWEFLPIAGQTFRDTGTGVCH